MYQLSATLTLPKFQYNLPNFLILNAHVGLAGSISSVSHLRNLSPFIFYLYLFIYFRKILNYRNV